MAWQGPTLCTPTPSTGAWCTAVKPNGFIQGDEVWMVTTASPSGPPEREPIIRWCPKWKSSVSSSEPQVRVSGQGWSGILSICVIKFQLIPSSKRQPGKGQFWPIRREAKYVLQHIHHVLIKLSSAYNGKCASLLCQVRRKQLQKGPGLPCFGAL